MKNIFTFIEFKNSIFFEVFEPKNIRLNPIPFIFGLIVLTTLMAGCEWIDPPQKIPAYIQVDSFQFQTDTATGFNTQKISEVWIFVNGEQIGVYPVPSQPIPALFEGNSKISILPGVYADGIVSNKVYYPFYQNFEETRVLEKGKVSKVYPKFKYANALRKPFIYYMDFEQNSTNIGKGKNGNVTLEYKFHPPGESKTAFGNRYGLLSTTSAADIIEFTNEEWVQLNKEGRPVYLEFDYKSTCQFQVGLYGAKLNEVPLTSYDLVLNPRETWTKIYVNLTDEVGDFRDKNGIKYRFFLRTFPEPGAGNSLSIDNVRLINFP